MSRKDNRMKLSDKAGTGKRLVLFHLQKVFRKSSRIYYSTLSVKGFILILVGRNRTKLALRHPRREDLKMLSKLYNLMISGTIFGLFLQVVPITVLVGAAYAIYRWVCIKRHGLTVQWGAEIMRWLFVCYLTGLVNLILVPAKLWTFIWANIFVGYSHSELAFFSGEWNLVPTLFRVLTGELTLGSWVLKMLVYNFLMFLPFGFFLPFVSEKVNAHSIWKYAILVPVVVEVIQPIVGRSFDVDDLILNFAGIVVGFFVAAAIKNLQAKKGQTA
jgi:glycopeptide antibiotics resistance protein